jgi:tetratricopeptide (TPR) repeat protein
VLLGATLVACWRRSWIGFAAASFFVILAPTSSFIPINDPAFEHRMYLPLAAVLVLVVVGAWQLAERSPLAARRALPVLAGAAIVVCAGLTVRRNHDYRSRLALAEATVACAPQHGRAHGDLGAALYEAGRTEEALPEMLEALRLDPTLTYTYLNLGAAYFQLGDPERGLPYFERAVQVTPDAHSFDALGYALFLQGDAEGAAQRFERAIAVGPDEARLHQRLAAALAQLGRTPEAIESYRDALRRAPDFQEAHLGLAQLLRADGKTSEALEHVQAALALPPDSADERFTAGQVFRALGRLDEAEQAFLAASQLAPELAEPRMAYAETVCQEPGAGREKRERARTEARRANELARGSRPEVLGVLALVEAACGDFARAVAVVDEALRLPGLAQRTEQQLQAQRAELLRRAGVR